MKKKKEMQKEIYFPQFSLLWCPIISLFTIWDFVNIFYFILYSVSSLFFILAIFKVFISFYLHLIQFETIDTREEDKERFPCSQWTFLWSIGFREASSLLPDLIIGPGDDLFQSSTLPPNTYCASTYYWLLLTESPYFSRTKCVLLSILVNP